MGADVPSVSPRDTCLDCGTPLVPYGHWALCPVHEEKFLKSVTAPTIAELIEQQVGGLLRDKGRPTVNGVKK